MHLGFVGLSNQIINLNVCATVEDISDELESKALVTLMNGDEIEVTGDDADLILERANAMAEATNVYIAQLTALASTTRHN